MSRFAAVLLALGATLLLDVAAARAQTACSSIHCDALIARLMITGETCGSYDPSQLVEYSQLVTAMRDIDANPSVIVYPAFAFDERLNGQYEADDPGFNAVPTPCSQAPAIAPLPGSRAVHVDFLTEPPTAGGTALNILYWDGMDTNGNGLDENDVSWGPVVGNEILRLDFATTATADGSSNEVEGIWIGETDSLGRIHTHLDFELRVSGGGFPTEGVYLIKLDHTVSGFAEGAPGYFVFSTVFSPAGSELAAVTHVENQLIMTLCSDGIDNDRDGLIDFAGGDPGCTSALDDSEKSTDYECDDGIDNDGDGMIDYRAVDFGSGNLYASRDTDCDSQGVMGVSEAPEPSVAMSLVAGVTMLTYLGRRRTRSTARRS